MRRMCIGLSVCFFHSFILGLNAVNAGVMGRSDSGAVTRWSGQRIELSGFEKNSAGISSQDLFRHVVASLLQWKEASNGGFQFDYWQGSDSKRYLREARYNGQSSLFFASQNADVEIHSQVLALTRVWFTPTTGELLEADIVLNDRNYAFTTHPTDSAGPGNGQAQARWIQGRPAVFIGNVLTHELGHAVGLSHSATLQASLYYIEAPEQAYVSCDDQAGIKTLYSASTGGRISGRIVSPSGGAIFGAQVFALSQEQGGVVGSAMTNPDGRFTIDGLEYGTYVLMTEPERSGAANYPPYYGSINSRVCGGNYFQRSFWGDRKLETIDVTASNPSANVRDLTVRCNGVLGGDDPAQAETLVLEGLQSSVERMSANATRQVSFIASTQSDYTFSLLSYSIWGPYALDARIKDEWGREIETLRSQPRYTGASGFRNFDSQIRVRNLVPGARYTLEVAGSTLPWSVYPGNGTHLVSEAVFVLQATPTTESLGAGAGSENARCTRPLNLAASYQSPPGGPPQGISEDSVGFCAEVSARARRPPAGSSGDIPGAMASWFFPFGLCGFAWRAMRRRSMRIGARPHFRLS